MIDGYKKNIDSFADTWGTVIRRLSEPESRPLVFHCNTGKDRAGTCAALILLVLGVSEETVIHDYLLSNIYLEPWLRTLNKEIRSARIKLDQLAPILTAYRSYISALIEYLCKTYVSASNYLKQMAGISEKTLHKLKEDLLEQPFATNPITF
jgi:protein-tyrosine phosphatase